MKLFRNTEMGGELALGRLRFLWVPWMPEWSVGRDDGMVWIAWKGLWIDFYYHVAWLCRECRAEKRGDTSHAESD